MKRSILKGGLLVDPGTGTYGVRDVLVEGEAVQAIAPSLAPYQQWKNEDSDLVVLDAKGCYLFPGLVDIHAHLRVPGQEHKEDLVSGTRSAAAGGFCTVLAMPNTSPCLDGVAVVRDLQERISSEAVVRVAIVGTVTQGQKGRTLAPIERMYAQGIVAFSDDGSPVSDARVMREAMKITAAIGCPIISHCEESTLAEGGVVQEGEVAERLGVPGIPHAAEEVMVARDLCLAADTGAHLHLAHLSTERSVAMIGAAKERGVHVTAEVTPHHLVLTDEEVLRKGANAKMNPPLRKQRDMESLRRALKDGSVDAIASDHAPHSPGEKALALDKAPFGVIGFETTLGVTLSLVEEGVIGLVRAVELLTVGPARVMGLQAGTCSKDRDADIIVVDPNAVYTVDSASFLSKARNCPFDGWKIKGKTVLTMVRGETVFMDRAFFSTRETFL